MTGEELVRRMGNNCEKVVDKAALGVLGCKLVICCMAVKWWDEVLHQLVKDRRVCFEHGLEKDENWSEYLTIQKKLK